MWKLRVPAVLLSWFLILPLCPLMGCANAQSDGGEGATDPSATDFDPSGFANSGAPADDAQPGANPQQTSPGEPTSSPLQSEPIAEPDDAASVAEPQGASPAAEPEEAAPAAEPEEAAPAAEPEETAPAAEPEEAAPAAEPGEPTLEPTQEPEAVEPTPLNASTVKATTFPSAIACGETANASVEMLNTGLATWTRADGYKLGTVDDEDPFHETTREWLPDDASIPPGESWVFEFELIGPASEGVYTSDWRMVHEGVEWFGETTAHDITVTCPDDGGGDDEELDDATADEVFASAAYVRDNFPQFFDIEDLDDFTKRSIAYEMMTTVINDLRAKGFDARRCVANPGLPPTDPFLWCSDALVVGPDGEGFTIDIYQSWSFPANPQILITETKQTGVVTSDLIPLP